MSIFSTVAKSFTTSYMAAYRAESAHQVGHLAKAVQAGDKILTVNVTGATKAIPASFKRVAPQLTRTIASNLALTAVAMEGVDLLENSIEKHARRNRLRALVLKAASEGLTDEINAEIAILSRADERRTFSQWATDLPSRTARRITRVCLVEVGWWYMILTLPISATAFVLDLGYSLGVIPFAATMTKAFGHEMDLDKAMNSWPRRVFAWLVYHTFTAGMDVFAKGAAMRLHNRSVTRATTDAYPVLEGARFEAHKHVAKIVDGHTAFAWGEAFAEAIVARTNDTEDLMRALSQVSYWVADNIVTEKSAVMGGVRSGTPVVFRDLTTVTA